MMLLSLLISEYVLFMVRPLNKAREVELVRPKILNPYFNRDGLYLMMMINLSVNCDLIR